MYMVSFTEPALSTLNIYLMYFPVLLRGIPNTTLTDGILTAAEKVSVSDTFNWFVSAGHNP